MTPQQLQLIALICTGLAAVLGTLALIRKPAGSAHTRLGPLRWLAAPLAERMLPSSQAELELLVETLAVAGRRERDAVVRYTEERVITLLLGASVAIFSMLAIGNLPGLLIAVVAMVYAISGPQRRLRSVAKLRQDHILRGLPGTVDLLTTCVDAGLSLQHALGRVAREIGANHAILAEELTLSANEIDAGVPVADALRRMSRRVQVDELSALCGVIAQAHGLGAPIGRTLQDYAATSRRQRMSMLEEKTGKLAASLVLPLALFLLPAALLTIIGPSVLQLIEAFSQ
ncbi:MAG: type II secretion system F family protein [Deltaproteobacteria bacterium]|nr:type II secretion system F family protein [Deltaproteobacteria bacterium]